ncbi:MAG TPA: hypothetical protein VFF70_07270 [Anaerolineae bacterium]|nr:hypothetical protein [Anaerolineae bacterium]
MKRIRPWHIVALIGLIYVAITFARNNFDPLRFALIGSQYDPGIPNGTPGYDGQFAYQIARDPINGWTKIDVSAYRYQRIVYPIAARVLALGNVDLIPWTLIAINIAALIAGTWFTEMILEHYQVSRWYALVYGLNAGTLMSVRLDLTEPLAYALAQLGVLLLLQDRSRWAALAFAFAVLTKETTLLFVAGVAVTYLIDRRGRKLIELITISISPFAIWQIVLLNRFGQLGIGSGGALSTPFEIIPLRGLWSIASIDVRVFLLMTIIMLPMAVLPMAFALRSVWRDARTKKFDLAAALLLLNAFIILFTPQSTFREPLAMARFAVGLIATTLTYAAARKSKRGLNYALLWMFTLGFALNEAQLPN